MYGNSGMDFFCSSYGKDVPTFYDIEEIEQVYRLINELRHGKSATHDI